MTGFEFETTRRIVSADGAARRLPAYAASLGMRRAFVVTDTGLLRSGVLDDVLAAFARSSVRAIVFDGVQADPPESSVQAAVALAREAQIDGVIGIGGGSSLDTAKLVALLGSIPSSFWVGKAIYGVDLARGPRLPLVQVPTTAGTGSEVTPIAIVTTPSAEKKGVVSRLLYPDLAVLDATLTLGLPPRVTAMTGIDAMVHAIEAYTSRHKKNLLSDSLATRALTLLSNNLRTVLADGQNLDARRAMLEGSLLAGMAFANAPVAAVHALAYPLGGHFHVPHGLSNALVLLPVLEFNLPVAESLYAELAATLWRDGTRVTSQDTGQAFIDGMRDLVNDLGLERTLADVGVTAQDVPMLAADALKVQRLLVNNPRTVSYTDALAIYHSGLLP